MSSLLTFDLDKDFGLTTSLRSSAMVCLLGVNLLELLILTCASGLLDKIRFHQPFVSFLDCFCSLVGFRHLLLEELYSIVSFPQCLCSFRINPFGVRCESSKNSTCRSLICFLVNSLW